jgi:adenylosuccinate lyase
VLFIKTTTEDALWIKETEYNKPRCKSGRAFYHDKLKVRLSQYKEFIHFGLTSQDINNTAIPTKEVTESGICHP